jgi:predicted permease
MSGWTRDWAFVFRRLAASPGLVLAVVVSIGLGIAANATIFAMVSRFVLRAAPVGDPATLVSVHTTHDLERCCNAFSWPTYMDVRDQARSFSGVAAFDELIPASINGKGDPERVWGQATTTNYFDVAQLGMAMGRGFNGDEDHAQVIVLGHRLWQRRFAGDPDIVGKSVTLSGRPYTVVGVAPVGYRGVDFVLDPEFWVPLGNGPQLNPTEPSREARGYHWLQVIARLQPGVTHEEADAELRTMAGRFAAAYPETDKGNGFRFEQAGSLPPRDRGTILTFLAALSIVVLLVLCIAGANVTNLLLAQAAERGKEMAVRLALGATRGALQRLMLMESVVLAPGGGLFGFAL